MSRNIKNAILDALLALQLLFCFFPSVMREYNGDVSSCSVIIEDCNDTINDHDLRYESREAEVKSTCSFLSGINIILMADAVVTLVVCGMFCQNSVAASICMLISNVLLGIVLPLSNVGCLSKIYELLDLSNKFSLTSIGIFQIVMAVVSVVIGMIPSAPAKSSSPDKTDLQES